MDESREPTAGSRRPKDPRRSFVRASIFVALTIGLLALALASSDPSDTDYENAGMVIGVLGLALIPLLVWWVRATIRLVRGSARRND